MQKQCQEEKNNLMPTDERIQQLKKSKDNIVILFSDAIGDQIKPESCQKNITFHSDDLNEALNLITNLWNYFQQLQKDLKSTKQDSISIKNLDQKQEIYSSIILQSSQYQDSFMNSEDQGDQLKAESEQDNSLNQKLQEKKQNMSNVILEIDRRLIWLENIIKKGSSILSNKQSDRSKFSDEGFNLAQEQWNQENLQNVSQQNQTVSSVATNKMICTLEDLKEVQSLYKAIVEILKEDQQERNRCQQELERMKKKISLQAAEITRLQKLKKTLEKDPKENGQKKKQKISKQQNTDLIIQRIKDQHDQILKISQVANEQIDIQEEEKKNKRIYNSTSKIYEEVLKLQKQINEYESKIQIQKNKTKEYKIFILMGILEKGFLQEKYSQLPVQNVSNIWEKLHIPINKLDNEVIKLLKYQQETYFLKETNQDPEQTWISLNERFQNSLFSTYFFLENALKIQQDTLNQMKKGEKRTRKATNKTREYQKTHLQFIENQIEQKGLNLIKINIKYIIAQHN